jgi:hypothetical protein
MFSWTSRSSLSCYVVSPNRTQFISWVSINFLPPLKPWLLTPFPSYFGSCQLCITPFRHSSMQLALIECLLCTNTVPSPGVTNISKEGPSQKLPTLRGSPNPGWVHKSDECFLLRQVDTKQAWALCPPPSSLHSLLAFPVTTLS